MALTSPYCQSDDKIYLRCWGDDLGDGSSLGIKPGNIHLLPVEMEKSIYYLRNNITEINDVSFF